ncbi:MAG: cobalamin biosynthesis protein P47K [Planctomycetia bacterium]|nr:cobalamin biosynthesis protein P47K [Planctomycetia bacterium]
MNRLRYIMIGGFLGAGKTTTIARMARHYTDQGLKVGIVTNDQAHGLVDTMSLRAQGFDVGEVTGACFCCKFNDLTDVVAQLSAEQRPDVILAEPVGSCTDLAATVLEPLRKFYAAEIEAAPLTVLLKPEHGLKILGDRSDMGFSPKAAYIFLKQLEEADLVVVNKVDKLTSDELLRITQLIEQRFPGKKVIPLSARSGAGFAAFLAEVGRTIDPRTDTPAMDYDIYAAGEAELGWLNCTVGFRSPSPKDSRINVDRFLVDFLERLATACLAVDAEPAHLKVLATAGDSTAIVNWVCSDVPPEISVASNAEVDEIDLTVNARVALDPELLAELVRKVSAETAKAWSLVADVTEMQSFRPGRPMPTHRMPLGRGAEPTA